MQFLQADYLFYNGYSSYQLVSTPKTYAPQSVRLTYAPQSYDRPK